MFFEIYKFFIYYFRFIVIGAGGCCFYFVFVLTR